MSQTSQNPSSAQPLGTQLANISFAVSGISCALVAPLVLTMVLDDVLAGFATKVETDWWLLFVFYMVNLHCGGLYVFPALISIGVGAIALVLPQRYRGPTIPRKAIIGLVLGLLLAWVAFWVLEIAPAIAQAF